MSPPQSVLDAIDALSFAVPCLDECADFVALRYSTTRDAIVVEHPDPHCVCLRGGEEALALGDYILAELSRTALVAEYGEPDPVHVPAGSPL